MRNPARKVTSGDVARHVGVSQSAVSLVISGKAGSRVSAATAERIRQAATELGYSPNQAATALRTGVSPTLALAVPTIEQPFFSSVLVSAEREARRSGYSMVLLDSGSDDQWSRRLVDMLRGGMLAGAIAYSPTDAEVDLLADADLPIVLADTEREGLPSVRFDVSSGARSAAAHLLGLGHTSIGYLAASDLRSTYRIRHESFAAEALAGGARVSSIEYSRSLDFDDAVSSARRLLAADRSITAVMCDDDLLAAAVVRAAGVERVPKELSVVGIGNIDISRMITPELTTVELASDSIGARAVELLLQEPPTDGAKPRLVLPSRLIVRDSTAPVSASAD